LSNGIIFDTLDSSPRGAKGYTRITPYKGKHICYVNHRYSVIDTAGNVIIPESFSITRIGDIFVTWYKLFDSKGNVICEYDWIQTIGQSFQVRKNGLYGVVDSGGKLIIPLEYDYLTTASENDIFKVLKNGLYGLIDKDNRVIVDLKYVHIGRLIDGVAEVCECDEYFHLRNFNNKTIRRYEKKGYVLLSKSATMCKNPVYSQLRIEIYQK
jgi:hypothetical protein